MRHVAHAQRELDVGVVVAELAEAHRQVEDENVPCPGEQRVERVEQEEDDAGEQGQPDHREPPGQRAVAMFAGVEVPFEKIRQPGQRPVHELLVR